MMPRVSYWLRPAAPDREPLAAIIRDLAQRFDAPVFDPHVTFYSGPVSSVELVPGMVDALAREHEPLTLRTTGLAHSAQFTKTLFIECELVPALSAMSVALQQRSGAGESYELKPHVSLIYAHLDDTTRQRLAGELTVPAQIRFDAMRAVLTGAETNTKTDVEAWRVIAESSLTAPPVSRSN